MGKIKGFMEYDRMKEPVIEPKKGLKTIENSHLLQKIKNFKNKVLDVWIVESHFVIAVVHLVI